jgi:DNA-3-methyladenine glycosylase
VSAASAPSFGLAPLPRSFYARPTTEVARDLLGKLLVRTGPVERVARIVEVEAYLGIRDQASHARRGPTPRAAIMFGPPGHLYVYLIYGMHHCMNVVTETDGVAGAVLLRAAEPVLDLSGAAPATDKGPARTRPLSGPGKLCAGLGITRADNGLDVCASGLIIADDPRVAGAGGRIRAKRSARIGVDYAGAWAGRLLRFYVAGNPYVSGKPRD